MRSKKTKCPGELIYSFVQWTFALAILLIFCEAFGNEAFKNTLALVRMQCQQHGWL